MNDSFKKNLQESLDEHFLQHLPLELANNSSSVCSKILSESGDNEVKIKIPGAGVGGGS